MLLLGFLRYIATAVIAPSCEAWLRSVFFNMAESSVIPSVICRDKIVQHCLKMLVCVIANLPLVKTGSAIESA